MHLESKNRDGRRWLAMSRLVDRVGPGDRTLGIAVARRTVDRARAPADAAETVSLNVRCCAITGTLTAPPLISSQRILTAAVRVDEIRASGAVSDNLSKAINGSHLLTRISQMSYPRLACNLRQTLENQGYPANSCDADRGPQWVTAKGAICGSVSTAY
jgi:hypothetical protein